MARKMPEPVEVIKARRDRALTELAHSVPYISAMGISFERRGDELTATLAYSQNLIGNPILPALHGGAIGAFLEVTAIMELAWTQTWEVIEGEGPFSFDQGLPALPKTIDFTIDYLRSGLPRDGYARAKVTRAGRRYSSVSVEAWQDNRNKLFATGTGHFLMPSSPSPSPSSSPSTKRP